jgi:glycosyltransferase involved in cell wall biosynthesis
MENTERSMNFDNFLEDYQKVPVEQYANEVPDNPFVSVCVQTYQHVDYIRQCLDGILMQEVNFPLEILLGEDASSDGTREICIQYAEDHPNKIRLFLHKRRNNIQIGEQQTGRFNFMYNLFSAKGKYIALCPGDDYWTDPLKLQSQADFMEKNKDCSLCFHPTKVIYENGKHKNRIEHQYNNLEPTIFKAMDLLAGKRNGWTASLFFCSEIVQNQPEWFPSTRYGDVAIKMLCADKGNIGYIGVNAMSVYRRGVEGAWSGKEGKIRDWEEQRLINHLQLIDHFNEYTDYRFDESLKIKKSKHIMIYLLAVQRYCSKIEAVKLIGKYLDLILLKPKKFGWVLIRFVFGQEVYEFLRRFRGRLRKQ